MSDDVAPLDTRPIELAGIVLVIAGVLMLAGALSTSWADGRWEHDYDSPTSIEAGPLGFQSCDHDGCRSHGWKAFRQNNPRLMAGVVGIGELAGGIWALVVGLLAVGGSARALRPLWIRWVLVVLEITVFLLLMRFLFDLKGASFHEGAVFGLVGPALAWFALSRLARPFFRALDLTGDPTGMTLR